MRKYFALILLALCSGSVWGQDVVKPMLPIRAVNDFAGIFSGVQNRVLEDSLVAFKRATSNEVVIVTVKDLGNYDVSQYAMELLRQWGVGSKDKNNGVILLIKPRNENGGGKVYIAAGYGLEGALPDGRCGRIIDNDMMPYLKRGDYYGAATAGSQAIGKAIRGEYTADEEGGMGDAMYGLFLGLMFIFVVVLIVASKKGDTGKGDDGNSGTSGGGGWVPPIFMGGLGGFGGGRSSSGGGGFGGFGGFGGGSGGGGGAGRSF